MISLLVLKKKLQQNKLITLSALSRYFDTQSEQLTPMLEFLCKKNYICEVELPEGCGTHCTQCRGDKSIIYRWCASEASTIK